MIGKGDIAKSSSRQHFGDLRARVAFLELRAEAVIGICSHHIERLVAVEFERPGPDVCTKTFAQCRETRQRPIGQRGDDLAGHQPQRMRQSAR